MKRFIFTTLIFATALSAHASSVKDVRDMTGTADLPQLQLDLTAAESKELDAIPFRFFSSIELKRRFQTQINRLALDERLGKPLNFNPGLSPFQHRQMMSQYRALVCDKSLGLLSAKNTTTGQVLRGDDAFIDAMDSMAPQVVQSSTESDSAKLSSALESKLVTKVSAQIANASAQAKGENPSKVLGQLEGIDAFGGEHFRLHFKNLNAEVSLPMMLSFISQKDAAFVRVLECSSRKLDLMMAADAKLRARAAKTSLRLLSQTLREKQKDAVAANALMAKLSVPQLHVLIDTLVQLDARALLSPADFAAKQKTLAQSNAAEVEFLQFLNRELGDFRDTKKSVHLLRLEAQK